MSRKYGSARWSSFLLTALPVSLVGAHLTAAVLGLYTSAPEVTIVQSAWDASGGDAMVIEVRADDGRMGSGVRRVEFQIDSTSGEWMPLSWDPSSMTYKGVWKPETLADGHHALYVRATDNTGNPRTVNATVKVSRSPTIPHELPDLAPSKSPRADLFWGAVLSPSSGRVIAPWAEEFPMPSGSG